MLKFKVTVIMMHSICITIYMVMTAHNIQWPVEYDQHDGILENVAEFCRTVEFSFLCFRSIILTDNFGCSMCCIHHFLIKLLHTTNLCNIKSESQNYTETLHLLDRIHKTNLGTTLLIDQ